MQKEAAKFWAMRIGGLVVRSVRESKNFKIGT